MQGFLHDVDIIQQNMAMLSYDNETEQTSYNAPNMRNYQNKGAYSPYPLQKQHSQNARRNQPPLPPTQRISTMASANRNFNDTSTHKPTPSRIPPVNPAVRKSNPLKRPSSTRAFAPAQNLHEAPVRNNNGS